MLLLHSIVLTYNIKLGNAPAKKEMYIAASLYSYKVINIIGMLTSTSIWQLKLK